MRQRLTVIHEPQDALDPSTLIIDEKSLKASQEIDAARELRITFSIEELPQELYRALKACHEIHIRWSAQHTWESVSPFSSRVPPGLHVFFTPQPKFKNSDLICPMLKRAFGNIDCESPERSFTTLPNERFSQSASHQYYSPLASITDLAGYMANKLCIATDNNVCSNELERFIYSTQVDIDYDSISHALTITMLLPSKFMSLDVTRPPNLQSRLEVGILSNEKPIEIEELSLGGFLTVIGEDMKPSPTLFSFPSRHHPDPSSTSFKSSFIDPTGLHPTMKLQISGNTPPLDDRECKLHSYLTLPKTMFADKYQLSSDNSLFLSSKNISALRYISEPTDLEAPVYAVDPWGSALLLELAPPSPDTKSREWTAEIPLHSRYLPPSRSEDGMTRINIPSPVLFWACTAEEGSKFTVNPFDRVSLGYDGLFGGRSMFFHLSPESSQLSRSGIATGSGETTGIIVHRIKVPVLNLKYSWMVEYGTGVMVLLGFLWVLVCLFMVTRTRLRGGLGVKKNQ